MDDLAERLLEIGLERPAERARGRANDDGVAARGADAGNKVGAERACTASELAAGGVTCGLAG
jgi:hypothetical protein